MDILELILGEVKEIKAEVKETKQIQGYQAEELAVYNSHLQEHIARTKQLEERMQPVESHVLFIRKLCKLLAVVLPIILAIVGLILKLK